MKLIKQKLSFIGGLFFIGALFAIVVASLLENSPPKSIHLVMLPLYLMATTIMLSPLVLMVYSYIERRNHQRWINFMKKTEKFDAKIKSFGWGKATQQTKPIIKNKLVNNSKLLLENKKLLIFIDKHFDLFRIDSELYTLNLEQVKSNQQVLINHRLRKILEQKGFYNFEIDSYIVNSNDLIGSMIKDSRHKPTIFDEIKSKFGF